MSNYTDFLEKITSEKVVLLEIDELQDITDSYWIKHSTKLWKTTYSWDVESRTYIYGSGAWGYGAYGSTETTDLLEPERLPMLKVGSLAVEDNNWTSTASIAACEALEESFYWDQPNQILYIHPPVDISPIDYTLIALGSTQGFSNFAGYYDGLYYDGRMQSVPNMSQVRDVNYYGLISFEGGSVSLINIDGFFDKITNRGQAVRIFFGGENLAYSEYEQIFEGFIEEIQISASAFNIGIKDTRKLLQKSVPRNYLNTTDYFSLGEDEEGALIPIAYGDIKKGKAICIDNAITFIIADTEFNDLQSIDTVYLDGKSVTFGSVSLSAGTFVITDGSYISANDRDKITVDFSGANIYDGLSIIQDLLVNYTDVSYTSDFFNITEWEAYKVLLPYDLNLFIKDKRNIIDVIGEICYSLQGLFIIEGDGRITFRQQDTTKAVVKDIMIDELVEQSTVTYDQANYASTVRVGFDRSWEPNRNRYVQDESKEAELVFEYRVSKTKEVRTLLKSATDADTIAAEFLTYYGGFFPTFVFTTKTQNLDVKLEDNINLQTYFYETGDYASIKLEIIGISTNYNNFTTTFTGRFIEITAGEIDLTALIRWKPAQSYSVGNVVSSASNVWRAILPSEGKLPEVSDDYWQPAEGYYEIIYITSAAQPDTPTGDDPVGWTTYPPTRITGEIIWASNGFKDNYDELVGTWSEATRWTGDTGDTGDTGPQGPQGEVGPSGTISVISDVEMNYVPNNAQWTSDSLFSAQTSVGTTIGYPAALGVITCTWLSQIRCRQLFTEKQGTGFWMRGSNSAGTAWDPWNPVINGAVISVAEMNNVPNSSFWDQNKTYTCQTTQALTDFGIPNLHISPTTEQDGIIVCHWISEWRSEQVFYGLSSNSMFTRRAASTSWTPSGWSQIWNATSDGSGSGLNADLVDNLHGSQFLRSDAIDGFNSAVGNISLKFYVQSGHKIDGGEEGSSQYFPLEIYAGNNNRDAAMIFHIAGTFATYFGLSDDGNFYQGGWSDGVSTKYEFWTAKNDGSGSGLDADKLDGYHVNAGSSSWSNIIDKIPMITTSGVMEMGRYLDFHTNNSTADYDVRLNCSTADILRIEGTAADGVRINGEVVWNAGNFTPKSWVTKYVNSVGTRNVTNTWGDGLFKVVGGRSGYRYATLIDIINDSDRALSQSWDQTYAVCYNYPTDGTDQFQHANSSGVIFEIQKWENTYG